MGNFSMHEELGRISPRQVYRPAPLTSRRGYGRIKYTSSNRNYARALNWGWFWEVGLPVLFIALVVAGVSVLTWMPEIVEAMQ
jgi:hypothetical protein